ncbi:hypothetical protein KKE45_00640 [Patescibacteria group bacterium]|nr:hypothetical protein [Patescibacteria group bacterium]
MNTKLLGLKLILIIFFSWLLIHLIAIFGIFLALAYPIWWFLVPEQTPCFFCRIKTKNSHCPACPSTVRENDFIGPRSFSCAFYNVLLILFLSFISFGLVFAESKILFKLGFPPTPKTASFVIPSKGQFLLNEIFPMKIEIIGVKTAVNAVQTDITFDPNRLEVIDVLTKNSFANIFIQKEINNELGYTRLTGGLPNPGFFSDRGIFGTVLFQGKSPGPVKVEFLPSSMVLANDGRGTNILKDLASSSYLILPERMPKEQAETQKSAIIEPNILGQESQQETQMKFYQEGDILGKKSIEEQIEKTKKASLIKIFVSSLEKTNRFILTLWGNVFDSLFAPFRRIENN